MKLKKSIIFDLDGTLWNATENSAAIWNKVLESYPQYSMTFTKEKIAALMGKTMEQIGLCLFPDLSEEERDQIIDLFGVKEVEYLKEKGGVLYEGVESTIKELSRKYDLYIVSNCQDGYVEAFLYAHKMGAYFKDIEMSGRTGREKGYNISLLMERNGITDAVYVGDTMTDQMAAKEAGILFVFASYGFGQVEEAGRRIDHFYELLEIEEW